jgi:translation initiation factor 2B subunit (eIF-2B alpha/beta/delta family)
MQKPDYSKISPELRAKLEELDKQRPENQSLQKLQDIALMLQEIIMTDDEKRKGSNKTIEEFGALLTDARESLQTIAKT